MINLSKTPLNGSELEVLKKALNFAPSPLNIPVPASISSIEKCLSKVTEDASTARKHISQILMRAKPPPSNLPPPLCLALKSLMQEEGYSYSPI